MLLYSGDTPILFWGTHIIGDTTAAGSRLGCRSGGSVSLWHHPTCRHSPFQCSPCSLSPPTFLGPPQHPTPPGASPGCEEPVSLSNPQILAPPNPPSPRAPRLPTGTPHLLSPPTHHGHSSRAGATSDVTRGAGQDRRPSRMRHHRRHRPAPRQPGRK